MAIKPRQNLSPRERVAFQLLVMQGKTPSETAKELNVPVSNVKNWSQNIRAKYGVTKLNDLVCRYFTITTAERCAEIARHEGEHRIAKIICDEFGLN